MTKSERDVFNIIVKHFLVDIEEQVDIYEEMNMLELMGELNEPLKTKEMKRFCELVENRDTLKEYLCLTKQD